MRKQRKGIKDFFEINVTLWKMKKIRNRDNI